MTDFQIPHECSDSECHVYLVEDDDSLRAELAGALQGAKFVVHGFNSAESLLDAGIDYSPAVIVSDMVLPGISGIHLFRAIRQLGIETPLVFISGYSEPSQIIEGMKLGAVDFLWKPFKGQALLEAVCRSLALDIQRSTNLVQTHDLDTRWSSLSDREKEVCRLMLKAYGNKDISLQLGIKPDTANKHRMKVLKKMGVAGRPQLIELLKDHSSQQSE